jgi:hypothetical protein
MPACQQVSYHQGRARLTFGCCWQAQGQAISLHPDETMTKWIQPATLVRVRNTIKRSAKEREKFKSVFGVCDRG